MDRVNEDLLESRVSEVIFPALLHVAYDIGLSSISSENIERVYEVCISGRYIAAYSDPNYVDRPEDFTSDPLAKEVSLQGGAGDESFIAYFKTNISNKWKVFPANHLASIHYPTRFLHEMPDKPRALSLVESFARFIGDEEGKNWASMYNTERVQLDKINELKRSLQEYEEADHYSPPPPDDIKVDDLKNTVQALQALNESLKHEVSRLKVDTKDMIPDSSLAPLNAIIDELTRERNTLREVLDEERSQVALRNRDISVLKKKLEECEKSKEAYEKRFEGLEAKSKQQKLEFKETTTRLNYIIEELHSRDKEKEEYVGQLNKTIEDLRTENDDIDKKAREDIERLKRENDENVKLVNEQNEIACRRIETVGKKKIDELKEEMNIQKTKFEINDSGRKSVVDQLRQEVKRLEEELKDMSNVVGSSTDGDEFQSMLRENMRLNDFILSRGFNPDDDEDE
jgi:hypothetical protein